MTRGATFPESSPRWPSGPGRGRTRSREGLPSSNKVAGRESRGALALERLRQAAGTCWAASPAGRRTWGAGAGAFQAGSRAPPAGPAPHPPSSAPGAPLQQRGRPAAGRRRRRGRGRQPLAHKVVESLFLGGGERAAAACRGLSPAEGRGGASGSRSRLGNLGERCLPSGGSFLQAENSLVFGKLGARAPVPALHLDGFVFVFGGTTGQEDCTSQGRFQSVSKF